MGFELLAKPWWVNTAILWPFLLFVVWRKLSGLSIARRMLLATAIFAVAFGFLEATVVVHLRAALGLLPGFEQSLAVVRSMMRDYSSAADIPREIPWSLLTVEIMREAMTMIMLISVAFLAHTKMRERVALFFWMAALWDIFYYVALRLFIGWPLSFYSPDVLFLIPVPWVSQVWFPILVSALTMAAVLLSRKPGSHSSKP